MTIFNITKKQLVKVIGELNKTYKGNIECRECTPIPLNQEETKWKVLLGVKDSKGGGAKVFKRVDFEGKEHRKRTSYACWHIHGKFIDLVLDIPGAWIGSTSINRHPIKSKGDNWKDSLRREYPIILYESSMCDC